MTPDSVSDPDFNFNDDGIARAVELLAGRHPLTDNPVPLPSSLPEKGMGGYAALELLAPLVLGRAARLGEATALAHMDPPTPWITWAMTLWNASLNQNLLHPATGPVARELEARVVDWLAPHFGMNGGHMVPGSTVANLTALWAARELMGVSEVVHAETAHFSVPKAAHILGLRTRSIPCDRFGALRSDMMPDDLSRSTLVLTVGATSVGAIDDLSLIGRAAWTHVDAAWGGPLRLSEKHAHRLDGIEHADSVSISAHKWLFQPKESALVLFRDVTRAHDAISSGGAYLAMPNVGVLGSHGAVAVPLLATLLAWGREGIARRIDRCMSIADDLAKFVSADDRLHLFSPPQTGVVVWRPKNVNETAALLAALPQGSTSVTALSNGRWLRNVAANPCVDISILQTAISRALNMI